MKIQDLLLMAKAPLLGEVVVRIMPMYHPAVMMIYPPSIFLQAAVHYHQ
jgi:hypothetical protein